MVEYFLQPFHLSKNTTIFSKVVFVRAMKNHEKCPWGFSHLINSLQHFHFLQVLWAYYHQRIDYQSLWEILSTFHYWANIEKWCLKIVFFLTFFIFFCLFVKQLHTFQMNRGMEFVGINIASTLLCILSRSPL